MRNFRITVDGTAYTVSVEELDAGAPEAPEAPVTPVAPVAPPAPARPAATPAAPAPAATGAPGDITSPMAGTVVSFDVAVGQPVSPGQTVMVLEAMKMNTAITAGSGGTVSAIHVAVGASVAEGQLLLSIA